MVLLNSVISGFESILGSQAVHLAMTIIVIFFVRVPTQPFKDPNDSYQETLTQELQGLKTLMIVNHVICSVSLLLHSEAPKSWLSVTKFINITALSFLVFNMCSVSQFLFLNTISEEAMTDEYHKFAKWLSCEFAVVTANILGNSMFLFCRSIVIEKMILPLKN